MRKCLVELYYEMLTIEVIVYILMVFDVVRQTDMIWRLRNIETYFSIRMNGITFFT